MTARQVKSAARRRAMRAVEAPSGRRVLIYLRMSLDRTGEGAGIERQEQACRALCLARGWEVVGVIDDTISATDYRLEDRPGWQKAVGMIQLGEVDVVVCYHLDRLTRSMKDLETLIDLAINRGVGVATAQGDIDLTTDVGRMVGRILAAVAQAEGERKAERQILGHDQRVAAGRPMWVRKPFGYTKDGELVPAEAALIEAAYSDLLKGKTLTAIGDEWNAAGIKTSAPAAKVARSRAPRQRNYNPTGMWAYQGVHQFLISPRNAGLITQYGEVMGKGTWPAIVSEETWRAAVRILTNRQRPDSKSGKLAHLLSAIARCSVCGAQLSANRKQRPDGEYHEVYQCSGRDRRPGGSGTGHVTIDATFADGQIVRRLVMRMEETERVSFRPVPASIDTAPLRDRLRGLEERMTELVADRAADLIDRASFTNGIATARGEADDLRAQIAEAAGSYVDVKEIDVEYAYQEFDDLDLHEQRETLRGAFDSIEVTPQGRGRVAAEKAFSRERIITGFSSEWGGHRPDARSTWG